MDTIRRSTEGLPNAVYSNGLFERFAVIGFNDVIASKRCLPDKLSLCQFPC
jgi:hypothetical protein